MYLKKLQVENYRLLKEVSISLDKNLTLFVGKNNTGKTSLMEVIKFLISNASSLPFDDYPLDCRQELYTAISIIFAASTRLAFEVRKQVPNSSANSEYNLWRV